MVHKTPVPSRESEMLLNQNLVVYDIETVPLVYDFNELSEEQQHVRTERYTKDKPKEMTPQSWWTKRSSLFPEFAKIVAIGVLRPKIEAVSNEVGYTADTFHGDEKEIIGKFFAMLEKHKPQLVGWNSDGFDTPFVLSRAMHHGIPLPSQYDPFNTKPRERSGIDLMEVYKMGRRVSASLVSACAHLGVPSPKGSLDGSLVGERYYVYGKYDEIYKYVLADVIATREVYKKIRAVSPKLKAFQP